MSIIPNNAKIHGMTFFFIILFVSTFMGCDNIGVTSPVDKDIAAVSADDSESTIGSELNEPDEDYTWSTQEIYAATTEDDVEIKLLRYRPSPDEHFNEKRQPVLMLGGIFMNNDEYLPHTTELMKDVYSDMTLPEDIADWAKGDEYIEKDPMLYYNLGYYLWKQGFDPWFGNYRGTGRGDLKSESPTNVSNLDVPGCLDLPAMVKKINDVTGLKPVIGGHSTGGLVCWVYLQGAYLDVNEVIEGRNAKPAYIPHVKVSAELARERNSSVKGFIALDPAVAPNLPESLDVYWIWQIIGLPVVLPLDDMMEALLVQSGSDAMTMTEIMNYLFNELSNLGIQYPDSIFQYFDFFRTANVDPHVLDYFMRYATANGYLRMIAQYADWGIHLHMREGHRNGAENAKLVMPGERQDGDGYLYFEDHMINMTTPLLCLSSESSGMQITDRINDYLMFAKTPHELDDINEIPGTAHADLPIGYQAPTILFPIMSEWLNQL